MGTLRTSEIGKRLQEEWPDAYTALNITVDCHPDSPPIVIVTVYHQHGGHHKGRTFEECIAKVKDALGPKPLPPSESDLEVVLDHPAEVVGKQE